MTSPGARRGDQLFGEDRRSDPAPPLEWGSPTKVRQVKEASHRAIDAQRRSSRGGIDPFHRAPRRQAPADGRGATGRRPLDGDREGVQRA
jgi:hypothetical protein